MQNYGINVSNQFNELIIDVASNTYADIKECENIEDMKMVVVFNLCRQIGKGLEKLNKYFHTELSREDLHFGYPSLFNALRSIT